MSYPVVFDVVRPAPGARFDRAQVILRLVILFVLGMVGISFPWVFVFLYFALPAVVAVVVSTRGTDHFVGETAPQIVRVVTWLTAFAAYLGLLTDRFPTGEHPSVRVEVPVRGAPTVQSALWRLLSSLPEAFILAILSFIAGIAWLIACVCVLLTETYPSAVFDFQRGVLRWQVRLLAYHASLVEEMPPYTFETGPESAP